MPGKKLKKDPPASNFVAKCPCKDPDCTIDKNGPQVADLTGLGINSTIAALSMLKELAAGPGLGDLAPGLRAATGGALWIVETIASMGDNAAAFKELLRDALNFTLLIARFAKDIQEAQKGLPEQFIHQLNTFSGVIQEIKDQVQGLLARKKIIKFLFANADKVKIAGERQKLRSSLELFQTLMQMHIYSGQNSVTQINGSPKPLESTPKPTEKLPEINIKQVPKIVKHIIEERVIEMEKAYYQSTVVTSTIGNVTNSSAPVNIVNSAGAQIHSSGNIVNEIRQNENNSYGNHTHYNTYYSTPSPPSQNPYRQGPPWSQQG